MQSVHSRVERCWWLVLDDFEELDESVCHGIGLLFCDVYLLHRPSMQACMRVHGVSACSAFVHSFFSHKPRASTRCRGSMRCCLWHVKLLASPLHAVAVSTPSKARTWCFGLICENTSLSSCSSSWELFSLHSGRKSRASVFAGTQAVGDAAARPRVQAHLSASRLRLYWKGAWLS